MKSLPPTRLVRTRSFADSGRLTVPRAAVLVVALLLSAEVTKADDPPRVDQHGDPLPQGAVARMGTVRLRIGNTVNAIAWAPDGKLVAAAGEARFIHIWDPESAKEVMRLPTLASRVRAMTFSPDGKWLAVTGEYSAIHLWNVALRGDEVKPRQLAGHGSGSGLVFAPDSKTLYSCGYDGFIRVWDVAAARELRHFGPGNENWIGSIALDREGKLLVSRHTSLDDDRRQIVTASLWNPATGERIRQFGKPERARSHPTSYAAVFAPDGKTVAALYDEEMKIWNVASGAEVSVWKIRAENVAFAMDAASVYGSHDGQIHQWGVPSGRLSRSVGKDFPYGSPIALSPDGTTIAGGRLTVALWDIKTGKPRHSFPGHEKTIWSLFFVNEGTELLTAGDDLSAYRWDLNGKLLGAWKHSGDWVWRTAALSPDGKTLAVQSQSSALLVDPVTGAARQRFDNHKDKKWRQAITSPLQFGFSPDSRRVLSAGSGVDRHVRHWEADSAREIWNVMTGVPKTPVVGFALSPDAKTMYVTSAPGPVQVYEVGKAEVQRQIGAAQAEVRNLCLSRDGRRLAGVEGRHVVVWNAATGAELCRVPGPRSGAWHDLNFLRFSPDGRTVAIWDRDEPVVRCVEIASGQIRLQTTGHVGVVLAADFSADGRRLVTAGTDATALLWDVHALSLVGEAANPSDPEILWKELASLDARTAQRALVRLQKLGPKAVALLADRLKPDKRRTIAACIADLDDDSFRVRERASEDILSRPISPSDKEVLSQALAAAKSVEVRVRLRRILNRLGDIDPHKDIRRLLPLRGLEVLEAIGTPKARQTVEALAAGAAHAELTREAAATLKRMR
jgi:WD40 repeat protein